MFRSIWKMLTTIMTFVGCGELNAIPLKYVPMSNQ